MSQRIPCYVLAYFDAPTVKASLESILRVGDELDVTVIENPSDATEHVIAPYLEKLVRDGEIARYVRFDENISNNAFEVALACDRARWQSAEHVLITDGDITLDDDGWLEEELSLLARPDVFAAGVDFDRENLPIATFPDAGGWVPEPRSVEDGVVEGLTGVHLLMLRSSSLAAFQSFRVQRQLPFVDSAMHQFSYEVAGQRWMRTSRTIAKHLTWDLYGDLDHPYTRMKTSKSLSAHWNHRRYSGFTEVTAAGRRHVSQKTVVAALKDQVVAADDPAMSTLVPSASATTPAPTLLSELRELGQGGVADALVALSVETLPVLGASNAHSLLRTADVLAPNRSDLAKRLAEVQELQVKGLLGQLIDVVMKAGMGADIGDNVDPIRFPEGLAPPSRATAPQRLAWYVARIDELERVWSRLDPTSQSTMLRVLAYRILGHTKVRIMSSATELAEIARSVHGATVRERNTARCGGFPADLFDLEPLGYPIRLHGILPAIMHTFVLEQYCWDGPPQVYVRPGDVVVDGGACLGDTALLFAHLAGPTGSVHAFEFEPGNLTTLEANLALNPELAAGIDVVRHPLWSRSGESMSFASRGPGTFLGGGDQVVETRSVDGMIADGTLKRVDFLKLDIEGAELHALEGARDAIVRFRPRLAISVYHRNDDLMTIPAFIDELGLGYRFSLAHYTLHAEETVLYAWCDD